MRLPHFKQESSAEAQRPGELTKTVCIIANANASRMYRLYRLKRHCYIDLL